MKSPTCKTGRTFRAVTKVAKRKFVYWHGCAIMRIEHHKVVVAVAPKKPRVNDADLVNRFIFFYTLRFLWKENNHPVSELYEKIFPGKQGKTGNKTLYDKILRLEDVDLAAKAKGFCALTDIAEEYFLGIQNYQLPIRGFMDGDTVWKKYIKLRHEWAMKREGKSADLLQVEGEIARQIRCACQPQNLNSQREPFKRLVYFAQNGQKRPEKLSVELVAEVEKAVQACMRNSLAQLSVEELDAHYKILLEYAHRVDAMLTIKKWQP